MAKKEREKVTERSLPHRREASGRKGGPSGPDAWTNPIVMIALGGLVVAVVLAIGFLVGSRATTTDEQTAAVDDAGIPTIDVSAIGDTAEEDVGEAENEAEVEDAAELEDAEIEDGEADDAEAEEAAAEMSDEESAAEGETADDEKDADQGGADEDADTESVEDELTAPKSQYTAPVDQALDAETTAYFATIDTEQGPIVLELWPELAPQHVNSFVFLAREGFFDGLTFHRVVPGFVIQGGDPEGTGMGGPGYSVPAEFNEENPVPHRVGTLAMARSDDPDSAGSQFYIVLEDGEGPTSLDGQYTVFGHVISGMDVVQDIEVGDVMTSVTIEEKPIEESVVTPDDIRNGNLPDND